MTESEEDPLKHADVGETATVQDTVKLHAIELEPNEFRRSDRFGHAEIVDTEITTDEFGDQELVVTVEGEVTKQLPRRWDYCREPRTKKERKRARRRKWGKRISHGVIGLLPIAIAFGVSTTLMSSVSGDASMNGEPLVFPTGLELLAMVAPVLTFAMLIFLAIKYRLPRMGARV